MRILFVFNLAVKNPLFLELVHRLQEMGYQVMVYDFISGKKYDPSKKTTAPITSFWWSASILKLKYVRRLFIPAINKKCIEKEFHAGDIVNIHYVHPDYLQYVVEIKKQGCKLITTFWGSDFLRASILQRNRYHPLLKQCDAITMVEGVRELFISAYPEYRQKVRTTYFGLKLLDVIKSITTEQIIRFKNKYKVSSSNTTICVGYNASPAQQHHKLISALKIIKPELRINAHLFFPLTYGGDAAYKEQLKAAILELGMPFTVFEKRLTDLDLATLRCATDMVLNIQQTDAFSGSLSESLAAGSLLLVGDWLPYDAFDEWGVIIKRSSQKHLPENIENGFKQLVNWEEVGRRNREIILNKLAWPSTLKLWDNLYKSQ